MENNFQFFTLEERYLHFWVFLHNIEYLFRLIFQTWWTYNWKKWLEHWYIQNPHQIVKNNLMGVPKLGNHNTTCIWKLETFEGFAWESSLDDLLIIFFSDFPSGIKKLSLKDFPMK